MALCLRASTLDDLLRSACEAILEEGQPIDPTRGEAREIVGACLELTNPRARLSRTQTRRREVSTLAELSWYLSGTNRVEPIAFYIQKYSEEQEADGTIHGAYGPRIFGQGEDAQIANIVNVLKENPTTRRAVVQIFDRGDLSDSRYADVPCTTTLQFLMRDGVLHLVVNMRSNDAYFGLPHDVFAFTMIQELVARSLNIELGRYVHMVGSLHLYERHSESVQRFLGEGWQSTLEPMPAMPRGDPWAHVGEFLAAEEQIRNLADFHAISLPKDQYWADLARVLASWVARRKLQQDEVAASIRGDIQLPAFQDFD